MSNNDTSRQWDATGLTSKPWWAVAVSGDGSTAVAVGDGNAFFIRKKNSTGKWGRLAPSGPYGTYPWRKLVLGLPRLRNTATSWRRWKNGGSIYTSSDGGATWAAARIFSRLVLRGLFFRGRTLLAGGITTARRTSQSTAAPLGGDGRRAQSMVVGWVTHLGRRQYGDRGGGDGSHLQVARDRTTPGQDGYISGGPLQNAIELRIYRGNDLYEVRSHEGRLDKVR